MAQTAAIQLHPPVRRNLSTIENFPSHILGHMVLFLQFDQFLQFACTSKVVRTALRKSASFSGKVLVINPKLCSKRYDYVTELVAEITKNNAVVRIPKLYEDRAKTLAVECASNVAVTVQIDAEVQLKNIEVFKANRTSLSNIFTNNFGNYEHLREVSLTHCNIEDPYFWIKLQQAQDLERLCLDCLIDAEYDDSDRSKMLRFLLLEHLEVSYGLIGPQEQGIPIMDILQSTLGSPITLKLLGSPSLLHPHTQSIFFQSDNTGDVAHLETAYSASILNFFAHSVPNDREEGPTVKVFIDNPNDVQFVCSNLELLDDSLDEVELVITNDNIQLPIAIYQGWEGSFCQPNHIEVKFKVQYNFTIGSTTQQVDLDLVNTFLTTIVCQWKTIFNNQLFRGLFTLRANIYSNDSRRVQNLQEILTAMFLHCRSDCKIVLKAIC